VYEARLPLTTERHIVSVHLVGVINPDIIFFSLPCPFPSLNLFENEYLKIIPAILSYRARKKGMTAGVVLGVEMHDEPVRQVGRYADIVLVVGQAHYPIHRNHTVIL